MSRTSGPVKLPELDAAEAVALGTSLVNRGHSLAPLPTDVGVSLALLETRLEALRRSARKTTRKQVARYWQVLGLGRRRTDGESKPPESLHAFTDALRTYVVHVMAHERDGAETGAEMFPVDALLEPISERAGGPGSVDIRSLLREPATDDAKLMASTSIPGPPGDDDDDRTLY